MTHTSPRIAGHAVVEQLVAFGVDRVFGVPGESYLDVLDGLYEHRDEIEMVITRQEGGAAMMAAAYGQTTGRPGVCLVTRGPGATNASIGVHVASQDASPMVLCIGQVPRRVESRQAFQEVDYQAMFGTLAKEVLEINLPSRAPEIMARALTVATSGEPGPVVVVFPEDVLLEETDAPVVPLLDRPDPQPSPRQIEHAVALLTEARSPLIVAGSVGWDAETAELLRGFAERSGIPVATAVRRQDLLPNDSSAHVGTLGLRTTPGLERLVSDADTVLLLGTRPDALTLANVDLHYPSDPSRRFIHVYPNPEAIGRVYPAEVAVTSSPRAFLAALPDAIEASAARTAWLERTRENYADALEQNRSEQPTADFMTVFDRHFDSDTIITIGAGNYSAWVQRHRRYTSFPSQIGSQSGAMGYGIPAAAGVGIALPGRRVVSFAGDGCFLMNGQELSTIARYGLDVLVVLINNARYGTIRDHQERRYPDRVVGTELDNPDFVKLAESYGARARRVGTPEEFDEALRDLAPAKGLRFVEIELLDD